MYRQKSAKNIWKIWTYDSSCRQCNFLRFSLKIAPKQHLFTFFYDFAIKSSTTLAPQNHFCLAFHCLKYGNPVETLAFIRMVLCCVTYFLVLRSISIWLAIREFGKCRGHNQSNACSLQLKVYITEHTVIVNSATSFTCNKGNCERMVDSFSSAINRVSISWTSAQVHWLPRRKGCPFSFKAYGRKVHCMHVHGSTKQGGSYKARRPFQGGTHI